MEGWLGALAICILRSRRHVGQRGVGPAVMNRAYAYTQWHLPRSRAWIIIGARDKSLSAREILPSPLHPRSLPSGWTMRAAPRRRRSALRAKLVIITLNYRYIRIGDTQRLVRMRACSRTCVDNLFDGGFTSGGMETLEWGFKPREEGRIPRVVQGLRSGDRRISPSGFFHLSLSSRK